MFESNTRSKVKQGLAWYLIYNMTTEEINYHIALFTGQQNTGQFTGSWENFHRAWSVFRNLKDTMPELTFTLYDGYCSNIIRLMSQNDTPAEACKELAQGFAWVYNNFQKQGLA